MQKLSRKYSNIEYAPGLALYGIDGADGTSGQSGCSLFVCKYDITNPDNSGASQFGTHIKQGLSMTQNEDKPIGRAYINGDVFLFPDGYLYKLTDVQKISVAAGNLTHETFKQYTELVGHVNVSAASDNFSEATGRLVLDTDAYKGFIINMSDVNMETAAGDINAPLTIISSQETGNGRIYFMGLKSIYAGSSDAQLDIYFDTRNNAYVIDSDKDILIDADVRVSASGDTNEYDDYSHVLTQQNSVTAWGGVCSDVTYEISMPSYVYEPDSSVKETYDVYYESRVDDKWTFDLNKSRTKYVTISVIRKAAHKEDTESKNIEYEFLDVSSGEPYNKRTFMSGTKRCKTTDKIFVPLVFSNLYPNLVVTAPEDYYVVVKSDGENPAIVDMDQEAIKKDEIQAQDDASTVIITTDGLYDPTSVYQLRYVRKLTLYNEAGTTSDMLKTAIVHVDGIYRTGTHKNQKVMEYYVQFDGSAGYYPKAGETLDVSLYSDYGLETPADKPGKDNDYRWEVSLIGNTEFFIKQK